MNQSEFDEINEYLRKPFVLEYTADEVLRVKNNLNCKHCEDAFSKPFAEKRKHTKESRCGKCKLIAEHLKENKVLTPKLF